MTLVCLPSVFICILPRSSYFLDYFSVESLCILIMQYAVPLCVPAFVLLAPQFNCVNFLLFPYSPPVFFCFFVVLCVLCLVYLPIKHYVFLTFYMSCIWV